jgi:acetyl-CoA acyltransferase
MPDTNNDVVLVSAVRSAVAKGKAGGALCGTHPIELSALLMKEAVTRAGVNPAIIDDVAWGCAMPEAAQGLNVARLSALRAGFPVEVPGQTINRFCSSGLQTIANGAMQIMSGMADVVLAGGIEMMSQVPMSGYHARLDADAMESYIGMGFTAERVADRWKVSRADQDAWALRSQLKATEAMRNGSFDGQIVSVPVERVTWKGTEKQVQSLEFAKDELPRAETTPEGLAKLRPAFKATGTVTAGNASPYSDGAAAVLLMRRSVADAHGLRALARFVNFAVAGVDPDIMGVGPLKAVPKVLARADMALGDIDLIEFNEAFASQVLAVMRELKMDENKVNVNGGAIALGHPLGATGAKLTTQIVHELARRGGGHGLVTMCIGGGMGAAAIFEVYPAAA